jgi:glutamyl-tRNA reductase
MVVNDRWSERLVVVATSFRQVGFGRLGTFAIAPDAIDDLQGLKAALGLDELVFLSTCNRIECYGLLDAPQAEALQHAATDFFRARGASVDDGTFWVKTGQDAARHLLTVTASLDSLLVGETEISGQARRASERAKEHGLCGRTLHALFQRAIASSRRVRAETAVGNTPVSAATIALQKVRKHFGQEGPGVTVLVGVGDMCRKVARALNHEGSTGKVIVVNRTLEKAERFCAENGGVPMSLEAFKQNPPGWVDLMFTATSAEQTVIDAADLAPALEGRRKAGVRRPLIVCDLGLPRDVDPALEGQAGIRVVSMDQMQQLAKANQAKLDGETRLAKEILEEELSRLLREEHFRCLASTSTEAMLDRQLPHLEGQDREAILKFVSGLAKRMARQPFDLTG